VLNPEKRKTDDENSGGQKGSPIRYNGEPLRRLEKQRQVKRKGANAREIPQKNAHRGAQNEASLSAKRKGRDRHKVADSSDVKCGIKVRTIS